MTSGVLKVLGVITARGGSKGIPGKNLKMLAGKPLLAYTVESARASHAVDRLVLSTDDAAIADLGRALGCEVPFMRPAELSQDDTPHLPVVQHAVQWLRDEGYECDAVMTLQPTSPLRTAEDIVESIRLLRQSSADSLLSVSAVPDHVHPMRMLKLDDRDEALLFVTGEPVRRRINRRQDLPPAWTMNGAIYLCRTHVLFAAPPSLYGDRVLAYRMPAARGLSLDEPDDWATAERTLTATEQTRR